MRKGRIVGSACAMIACAAVLVANAVAQDAAAPDDEETAETAEVAPPVEFTEEFLHDPEVFEVGREIWTDQCAHCHGRNAYPGKAPRLRPRTYTPDFVYQRVTKGFRGMPPWEDVYDEHERMAVVAYVMSRRFSP
ncbi:MAG TPA: cytochrome c [Geminicoccaceae bacterium]|nr:cytochrome c [Geminicoccaceae bacterium]